MTYSSDNNELNGSARDDLYSESVEEYWNSLPDDWRNDEEDPNEEYYSEDKIDNADSKTSSNK